jgi:hypothetical protein
MSSRDPANTTPEPQKPGFWRNGVGFSLLAVGILVARLPLWLLPGPGRDEAAYHYWVHHPEPFYAPLLQWSVAVAEVFGGHSLWSLRAPVLILGLVILWLNDRRLAGTHTPHYLRWLAAMAIAFSPWQGFAGSILHPDNFLLAALLALVLAVQNNRLWWATIAAITAVLAKPTGLIFLPVVWWLVGKMDHIKGRDLWASRALLLALALAAAATLKPDMVRGMADFGRLADTVPWYARGLASGGALLFLGGPVLVILSVTGARQRWQNLHPDTDPALAREARASLAAAAVMLVVFLSAALLRGQFKGNWVLPALVLLWPLRLAPWMALPRTRTLLVAGVVLAFASSLGQTLILRKPDLIDRMENGLSRRGLVPAAATYSVQAGVRETAVSSSRSWSDHLRQYHNAAAFAGTVKAGWCQAQGELTPVPCIVSDDYGLACQLHWYLGEPTTKIAISGDGIVSRTWNDLRDNPTHDDLLVLMAPAAGDIPHGYLGSQTSLAAVLHPVTGQRLQPMIARWHDNPNQETPDVEFP